MECTYCRHANSGGEHRCARCGRRLAGQPEMETWAVHRTTGNLAAAAAAAPEPAERPVEQAGQSSLFTERQDPKIIPFPSITSHHLGALPFPKESQPGPVASVPAAVLDSPAKPPRRHAQPAGRVSDKQPLLDFLPPAAAAPRRLKTSVEAVIYCDAPVAAPLHRATATALDAAMIGIGFAVFLGVFRFLGGAFIFNTRTMLVFLAAFGLISGFYGLLWALATRETAGMQWAHLRLIDFDGFPPDGRSRVMRYAGAWISFCALGMGLLWALMDEESLTWQDHISRTFPTLRESNSSFFRKP